MRNILLIKAMNQFRSEDNGEVHRSGCSLFFVSVFVSFHASGGKSHTMQQYKINKSFTWTACKLETWEFSELASNLEGYSLKHILSVFIYISELSLFKRILNLCCNASFQITRIHVHNLEMRVSNTPQMKYSFPSLTACFSTLTILVKTLVNLLLRV